MRSFRRVIFLLATLSLPTVADAQSGAPGFQLQVDGVLASLQGTLAAANGAELSSLLSSSPGFAITASLGVRRHWTLGARVAHFGSEGDDVFQFVDEANSNGLPFTDGAGPYDLNRRLRATAVHGLLQYRRALGARTEWLLEGGGGVVSARERLVLTSATGEKASAVGEQLDPSWVAGSGLGLVVGWNTQLVASARWTGTITSDGAVWTQGDSPSYLHWGLGLRYPHDSR